jgi:hypothetical protein
MKAYEQSAKRSGATGAFKTGKVSESVTQEGRKKLKDRSLLSGKVLLSETTVHIISTPNFLKHTVKAAHDPTTGLIDAKRFAEATGFTLAEMSHILERTMRGITKNPTAPKIQDKLNRLIVLWISLLDLLDRSDENVRIWLRAPHPDLGYRSPISCLEKGQFTVVESLVDSMETGQSA